MSAVATSSFCHLPSEVPGGRPAWVRPRSPEAVVVQSASCRSPTCQLARSSTSLYSSAPTSAGSSRLSEPTKRAPRVRGPQELKADIRSGGIYRRVGRRSAPQISSTPDKGAVPSSGFDPPFQGSPCALRGSFASPSGHFMRRRGRQTSGLSFRSFPSTFSW